MDESFDWGLTVTGGERVCTRRRSKWNCCFESWGYQKATGLV